MKIFNNHQFITNSNSKGECEISDTINIINCNYLSIFDTTINIKNCNNCKVDFKINLLPDVDVLEKYDAKKHFKKLLEISGSYAEDIDTTIYYRFFNEQFMPETGRKELFECIMKINYTNNCKSCTGYRIIVVKIDNYYNDIAKQDDFHNFKVDSLYLGMTVFCRYSVQNRFHESRIKEVTKKNILVKNIYQQNDSTIFKLTIPAKGNAKIKEQRNYYIFENNKLKRVELFSEYDKNNFNFLNIISENTNMYYLLDEYGFNKQIFYKKSFKKSEIYLPKYKQKVIRKSYIENIANPNLEFELNEIVSNRLKYAMNSLKKKYPDLIIPSSPEAFYKFDF
ncbi:MAG: hypothetical protein LBV69_05940 [Bacteroidales bacterium]|nr:hypothetical protein [Bacteroidales bacterium]